MVQDKKLGDQHWKPIREKKISPFHRG